MMAEYFFTSRHLLSNYTLLRSATTHRPHPRPYHPLPVNKGKLSPKSEMKNILGIWQPQGKAPRNQSRGASDAAEVDQLLHLNSGFWDTLSYA
jgi:hypothetical protein